MSAANFLERRRAERSGTGDGEGGKKGPWRVLTSHVLFPYSTSSSTVGGNEASPSPSSSCDGEGTYETPNAFDLPLRTHSQTQTNPIKVNCMLVHSTSSHTSDILEV